MCLVKPARIWSSVVGKWDKRMFLSVLGCWTDRELGDVYLSLIPGCRSFTAVTLNLHFRFQGKSITCINWVKTLWLQYWGNRKAEKHVAGQAFIEKKKLFSFHRKLPAHCADDTKLKVPNAKFRLYSCLQFLVSVILKFTPQVWKSEWWQEVVLFYKNTSFSPFFLNVTI